MAPTDAKVVTCGDDATLRIIDFYRCAEEQVLRGHGWDVKSCDWHPTKGVIASGSKDNVIKLWDPRSGLNISTMYVCTFENALSLTRTLLFVLVTHIKTP